jgi:hypothetical protein
VKHYVRKPVHYTTYEVAQVIEDFLNGTGGPYDWAEFCDVPIIEEDLEEIRVRCATLDLEFPPERPGYYCSSAGLDVLRDYVRRLREGGKAQEQLL